MKTNGGRFEGRPTYLDDFRQWELPKVEAIKPEPNYTIPSDKFGGLTTYDLDFTRHIQPRRSMIKPGSGAIASDEPFDGRTSYKADFITQQIPIRFVKEKAEYRPTGCSIESLTTNRRDFTPKEQSRMPPFKPNGVGFRYLVCKAI
jgi:hypothetical protein